MTADEDWLSLGTPMFSNADAQRRGALLNNPSTSTRCRMTAAPFGARATCRRFGSARSAAQGAVARERP